MQKENDHIIIIGAGIGGLTSALLLSHQGFKVTVIEKNEHPGGKLRSTSSKEGPIDAGPTVLTLIDVFEDINIGEDFVSYTFRLSYRDKDKTLLDSDITSIHLNIISKVEKAFNTKLRN